MNQFIATFTPEKLYLRTDTITFPVEKSRLRLYAAPLQGYTEAEWRHCHAETAGGADAYYMPFIRVEKGTVRRKDLAEINSGLNSTVSVIPQVIVRDAEELRITAEAIIAAGYSEIDINMGCPFAPQVKHGRGAALIAAPSVLRSLSETMRENYPGIKFSAKMRLGVTDPAEWRDIIGIINDMPLTHLTVHPRTASQQYGGGLHLGEFGALLDESVHPVVFNGDITSPADIDLIAERYPTVSGIMAGRGLLMRPTLFAEWRSGKELTDAERLTTVTALHDAILKIYRKRLCGDAQILSKIKPFWEYQADAIGHKAAKAIRKATSMQKYEAALAAIRQDIT